MEYPAAIERQQGKQIESVDDHRHHRDLLQNRNVIYKADNTETCAKQDSRDRPHQRHNHLLPTRHVVVLAGHGSAEERNEEHAKVPVMKCTHRQVVSQLVNEQYRQENQQVIQ
ncbi:hypothetical protein SDC9_146851 [bioreactor metagenome]|uniref:Uncharacterized protein n=1 Tax=bioreactor metagenome TaxID=1076179 RepID=A0A645EEW5_9ZZZZ